VTGSKDADYARIEGIWLAEKCRVARMRTLATTGADRVLQS